VTRASRFLIGLVTCFATRDGIPAAALRHFCLDGTDHESHEAQACLIRRHIAWRNRHAQDRMLREVVKRANVA
jgi:hypothetical protein